MKKAIKTIILIILFLALSLFSCFKYYEWKYENKLNTRLYEENLMYKHLLDSSKAQINAYKDSLKVLRDLQE